MNKQKAIEKLEELAAEYDGYTDISFDMEGYEIESRVFVTHHFEKGDHENPSVHTIDVEILEFEMNLIPEE